MLFRICSFALWSGAAPGTAPMREDSLVLGVRAVGTGSGQRLVCALVPEAGSGPP